MLVERNMSIAFQRAAERVEGAARAQSHHRWIEREVRLPFSCEAVIADWMSWKPQRLKSLVLIARSLLACLELKLRWSVGRML